MPREGAFSYLNQKPAAYTESGGSFNWGTALPEALSKKAAGRSPPPVLPGYTN
jgi:hypothetical protein